MTGPDALNYSTVRGHLSRRRCLALVAGLLARPLMASTPGSGQGPPSLLIGILTTGHMDPSRFDALEQQIRSNLPELAARLTLVSREARFIQTELVRKIDELASLHPAVLVCLDLYCANVAKARLRGERMSTPIVFLAHADPVAGRLIESYAHPGNNLTGVTTYRCIDSKMLEILAATFPTRKRIGYLLDATDTTADDQACVEHTHRDAARLQVDLIRIDVSPPDFLARFSERMTPSHLDAVLAPASAPLWQNRKAVVQALNDARLPAIYESDIFLAEGGLMSYGPVQTDAIPQLAKSVSKIVRGESAGDIPVEQPTLFEFVMNLRAPHFSEFGIKAATLRRADRILE
jgi:putative ABC transport system substrate-binding protein